MKPWSHIVIEAYCFGKCEKDYPTSYCLGDSRPCPYLSWSNSSEREAANYVPLRIILADRLANLWENIKGWIDTCIWWHFKGGKDYKFEDSFVPEDVMREIRTEFLSHA